MENILDILIRLAATLLCYGAWLLTQKVRAYLKDKAEYEKLDKFLDELVIAADQMLKKDDDDGSKRLEYVQGMLIEAGYELTDALRAKIEAKVFQLNLVSRGVN